MYLVLRQALPAGPTMAPCADAEEVLMREADLSSMGQSANGRGGGACDEEDDEEGRGGQRVQCAQQ